MDLQLRITTIQANLLWEDIDQNLENFSEKIVGLHNKTDLIILPEMFSTGFSMTPHLLSEPPDGKTTQWMKQMAEDTGAVITGSIIIQEHGNFYNRLIWMQPDGMYFSYDKKHLFRMAGEDEVYSAGTKRLITNWKGWKILPLICYDLRFPVWCRNSYIEGNYDYDLLIFIANWPQIRSHAWKSLLVARAIENMAFVAGVNRVGEDKNKIMHIGDSVVLNPLGEILAQVPQGRESIDNVILKKDMLVKIRNQFAFGRDWDNFMFV
jgi:omega-amidase